MTPAAPAEFRAATAALNWPNEFAWDVQVSARRQRVAATVSPGPRLVFNLPAAASVAYVTAALDKMRADVVTSMREAITRGPWVVTKELVSGEGFEFAGRRYRLRLVADGDHETSPSRPIALTAHPGVPVIDEPGPSTWSGHRTWQLTLRRDAARAETVIGWYRSKGQQWLDQHIPPVASRLGVDLSRLSWQVRNHRPANPVGASWARCNTAKDGHSTIRVDWAAFQLPLDLLNYLAVHEVAHAHPDAIGDHHGPKWQALVARLMPDWPDLRERTRSARGLTLWAGEVTTSAPAAPAGPAPFVSGWATLPAASVGRSA